MNRKAYPSDVSDEEWAFVAPYLTLMDENAPQRTYELRDVCNALCWLVKTGAHWRMMPHDLPAWPAVYEQTRRWLAAGVFEEIVHDLRVLLRLAAILDSRTRQSTPESGAGAGYDGAKRRKGRTVHVAVDTLGHLLALHATPANVQDRAQAERLAAAVQKATGETVEVASVDQGYTGAEPAQAAAAHGIRLDVVKLPDVKRGFVLLPKRWVVERDFAWAARFRRLARDDERLDETLVGYHLLAFVTVFLRRAVPLLFVL